MFKNATVRLGIVWFVIVPPSMIYLIINHFPEQLNWLYIGALTIFAFITVLFPIKQNEKRILLVGWITVPVFLLYGLVVEIIIMQIALLAMFFYDQNEKNKLQQFLQNSLLFFFLSIFSAIAFYFTGGHIRMMEFWQLAVAVVVYQVVHKGLHDLAKHLYANYKTQNNIYFSREMLIENMILLLIVPFILTLYYLVQYIGFGGFLLIGIPFFFSIVVSRLYNHAEKINKDLQLVGAIGHELSQSLTEEKVIDQFVENVAEMTHADYTYLFDHQNDWLELIRSWENHQFVHPEVSQIYLKQQLANYILVQQKAVIYNEKKEWVKYLTTNADTNMQSVLAIPIVRNQKIEGILLAFSMKKNAFEEYQLKIADIFSSYFTVSIEKARNVEETIQKSERCGLTKLYNYIYLEGYLEYEEKRFVQKNIDSLTVMMIDIDHFKKVNDTYGHESGNDVLIEFARILDAHTPKEGIVGRYGGEEFIFILPNMSKAEANRMAEELRVAIEAHRFTITPDLGEVKKRIEIAITVSIGLSSLPTDTDEIKALVRNADRALYLGAKRSGRNRVAGYVK